MTARVTGTKNLTLTLTEVELELCDLFLPIAVNIREKLHLKMSKSVYIELLMLIDGRLL